MHPTWLTVFRFRLTYHLTAIKRCNMVAISAGQGLNSLCLTSGQEYLKKVFTDDICNQNCISTTVIIKVKPEIQNRI